MRRRLRDRRTRRNSQGSATSARVAAAISLIDYKRDVESIAKIRHITQNRLA